MAERRCRHEPSFKDNADRWREITSNDSCESYRRFIRHRRAKCVKVAGYNGMTRDNGASTFNDSDNSKGSIRFELNFSFDAARNICLKSEKIPPTLERVRVENVEVSSLETFVSLPSQYQNIVYDS